MKKVTCLFLSIVMCLILVIPVSALEPQPRSGGIVSTTTSLIDCDYIRGFWDRTYLTSEWAPASSYVVTKTVTKTSSYTVSCGISSTVEEQLSANYDVEYGVTLSTENSIGTTIPADPTRYSKLRYNVYFETYDVVVRVTSKYYDTSLGYYNIVNDYEGTITVPIEDEAYIDVYYR